MGTRDLVDMYAQSPRAYISGKSWVQCYNWFIPVYIQMYTNVALESYLLDLFDMPFDIPLES